MLRVLSCVQQEHDLRLVAVAVLICLVAASIAFSAFRHASRDQSRRTFFLSLAAIVSGLGIWATHFVAMLAYQPAVPIGYDLGTTLLSIIAAVVVTWIGWTVAPHDGPVGTLLAGTALGGGIASMHYLGMAAVQLAGFIRWDPALVGVSIALGVGMSAGAVWFERRTRQRGPWLAAILLTGAICSLHFTAMAAAVITPTDALLPSGGLDSDSLALVVIIAIMAILGVGSGLIMFDQRLTRVQLAEARNPALAEQIASAQRRAWGAMLETAAAPPDQQGCG